MADRQAGRQSPGVGGPDDFADVRAMLHRADELRLDRWRVLVALEIPTDVRQRLLDEIGENESASFREEPSGADDAG